MSMAASSNMDKLEHAFVGRRRGPLRIFGTSRGWFWHTHG